MMLSNKNDIINNDRSYNLPALVILMQFFPFDACRAVTKALIGGGGGGGCIFIYSRSARQISFEINCNDN